MAQQQTKRTDIYSLHYGGMRSQNNFPDTSKFPSLTTEESVCIDINDDKYEEIKKALPQECIDQLTHECKMIEEEKTGHITFYPSPYLTQDEMGNKKFVKESFVGSNYLKHILNELNCDELEAIYNWDAKVCVKQDNIHSFLRCVETAFYEHYPLVLKPSHIQLLINQGIAYHMKLFSQQLRDKFVNFEDKMTLIVSRPNFVKGSKDNDWSGVIEEFADQVDKNTVEDTVPLLESDFTTSTALDRIANKVCIMDICQHYFEYLMLMGCGFPSIKLEGTKADWVSLKDKTSKLLSTKLDESFANNWSKSLLPVLDQFINAYDNKIDCLFWNSMVQRGGISASMGSLYAEKNLSRLRSHVTGWINVFFPYLNKSGRSSGFGGNSDNDDQKQQPSAELELNNYCEPYSFNRDYILTVNGFPGYRGPGVKELPIGIASAPVKYVDLNNDKTYDLQFGAGFIGIDQNEETLEVTPIVGWVVGENSGNVVNNQIERI